MSALTSKQKLAIDLARCEYFRITGRMPGEKVAPRPGFRYEGRTEETC